MLFALSVAAQASYFVEVGPEIAMQNNGTFHRTAPRGEDGWWFFIGNASTLMAWPTDNDHSYVYNDGIDMAGRDDLIDRAITKCPDGTWLYAGSGNLDQPNDSAWVFKADEDLQRTNEDTVAERSNERPHNDMTVVCSTFFSAAGFQHNGGGADIFEVDGDGNIIEMHHLAEAPGIMGGALLALEESQELVVIGRGFDLGSDIEIVTYDKDLQFLHAKSVDLMPDRDDRIWWPQSILKVGDIYLLAHMARDESGGDFVSDEGEVWVAVLDSEFEFVEHIQITELEGTGEGAMRPALSRRAETLVVSYDVQVNPRLKEVTLDLTGAHVPGDSADPKPYDDTGGASGPDGGNGPCGGCAAGPAGGGAVAFGALLALWARRRR